jgi:hypothetical protein
MKLDASFPQAPVAPPPARPVQNQAEQASARPVDRPHHDEAAANRQDPQHPPRTESRDHHAVPSHDADVGHHASTRADGHPSPQQSQSRNSTEPSRVGELLDVLA